MIQRVRGAGELVGKDTRRVVRDEVIAVIRVWGWSVWQIKPPFIGFELYL